MAPTDPAPARSDGRTYAPPPDGPVDANPQGTSLVEPAGEASGHEPLTADLQARGPRVSTRALVYGVAVLALLVLVAAVVALAVLHQPRLTPLPVPSVSSIA